jgi:PleD family two-component response regulator
MSATFNPRILVTVEEEFNYNILREVLISANFQVEAVTNLAAANAKIGNFDPMQLLQI